MPLLERLLWVVSLHPRHGGEAGPDARSLDWWQNEHLQPKVKRSPQNTDVVGNRRCEAVRECGQLSVLGVTRQDLGAGRGGSNRRLLLEKQQLKGSSGEKASVVEPYGQQLSKGQGATVYDLHGDVLSGSVWPLGKLLLRLNVSSGKAGHAPDFPVLDLNEP